MPGSYLPQHDILLRTLHLIAPLSSALRERIQALLEREDKMRREILLAPGAIADRLYFIESGFARTYVTDAGGREHTTRFIGEGEFIIPALGFFDRRPSGEYIQLLESSVLLSLRWDHLMGIYADLPEFNYHMRHIAEKCYRDAERRAISFRTMRPAERYAYMLRHHSVVLQKASLGQVASYLGVTQETLSRIRAQR